MPLARTHRLALCETALETGPDAPTLCPPWPVSGLVAHLVVRESRPDAAVLGLLPPTADRADRVRSGLATDVPFEQLVDRLASGPPVWAPSRLDPVADLADLLEFVIHHEDIRRAQPGWRAAPVDEATARAVWSQLRRAARLFVRRSPVGVVLVAPGHGRGAVKGPPARDTGLGSVVLTGAPVELALYLSGRTAVADVQVDGDDASVRSHRAQVGAGG
ncbi:TIGR03085 family metal-binding protein [Ornithinicoccus hortensis]|uniref:Uncharacterized protein (TIGR03085 family) n=1 Tax=Ornithinicoccus hortensis TaxID=82346 RepID=A0A542YSI1_9MICO|nr:TIGR03085 family metal-binding protein [Ornithinicoccus hortensis]TQL51055.1 uncharacterized protein (TIGR03085 family) [Ornithinicoccus hortensis]